MSQDEDLRDIRISVQDLRLIKEQSAQTVILLKSIADQLQKLRESTEKFNEKLLKEIKNGLGKER